MIKYFGIFQNNKVRETPKFKRTYPFGISELHVLCICQMEKSLWSLDFLWLYHPKYTNSQTLVNCQCHYYRPALKSDGQIIKMNSLSYARTCWSFLSPQMDPISFTSTGPFTLKLRSLCLPCHQPMCWSTNFSVHCCPYPSNFSTQQIPHVIQVVLWELNF